MLYQYFYNDYNLYNQISLLTFILCRLKISFQLISNYLMLNYTCHLHSKLRGDGTRVIFSKLHFPNVKNKQQNPVKIQLNVNELHCTF